MDYPISFNNTKVYSVPDTRFTRYGFALDRPTAVIKPTCPITPSNMLPYQVASTGIPYGYTLVPTHQVLQAPSQRMVPVPGGRNVYSYLDYEDEEDEYVPPPPRPRSRILEDIDSSEMDEFSATTRQLRKDADSIIQRLGTSRSVTSGRASNFWKTYDYDTRSLTPRYLAPPPDRSHLRPGSPTLDEEPDSFIQSLRPGRRGAAARSAPTTDRIYTPRNLTANRVQSLYKELDEPLYSPEIRSFDYTEVLRRDRDHLGDKVKAGVQRMADLTEPTSSSTFASSYKRDRLGYDSGSVKDNISIRAQYAAMRAAAGRGLRKLALDTPIPSAASAASAPSVPSA